MADLKTELLKIQPLASLRFDDDGDNTVEVVETPADEVLEPSVTRKIWDYIKTHPGCSLQEITHGVDSADPGGVSTRLNQLMRRGMITRSISAITGKHINHATTAEYVSMSREDRIVRMREGRAQWVAHRAKKAAKAKAKKDKHVPVPAPATAPTPTDISDVDVFVSRLTVADARNLYLALKRVFA
jgi:predicted transcriptional regulator